MGLISTKEIIQMLDYLVIKKMTHTSLYKEYVVELDSRMPKLSILYDCLGR